MSKHTPGPWHRVSTREQSGFLITANGAYGGICSGEDKANANLIAAAPDLLEALESIITNASPSLFSDGQLNQALAAIARAKGKSQ